MNKRAQTCLCSTLVISVWVFIVYVNMYVQSNKGALTHFNNKLCVSMTLGASILIKQYLTLGMGHRIFGQVFIPNNKDVSLLIVYRYRIAISILSYHSFNPECLCSYAISILLVNP